MRRAPPRSSDSLVALAIARPSRAREEMQSRRAPASTRLDLGEGAERSDLLEAVVARSTHIQVYVQMHHDASANLAHRGLSLRVTERSSQPAESARCWLSSDANTSSAVNRGPWNAWRSSTLGIAGQLVAPLSQKRKRRVGCSFSIEPAVCGLLPDWRQSRSGRGARSKLSVLGSTGPKEASGASQVTLCLGSSLPRRPASRVELSARSGTVRLRASVLVGT